MSDKKNLIGRYPISFLFILLSLHMFLTSCADKTEIATVTSAPDSTASTPSVPGPNPDVAAEAANGESSDLSCAYFYFLWGAHAENNKKYSEAQEAYEKALICDPEADYVFKKLPILLIKMEKLHAAAQWLREAIKKNPNDIDNQLLLARLYEKILELAPDNSTVRLRLGYLYSQQGRYKEGEATIKVLLIKDPNSYFALLYLARLAIQSADFDTAAILYEKILPQHWSPELVYEMIEFYSMREQYKRVEQLYASILKNDPENEQAALGRVHSLLLLDREKEALEELARIRSFSNKPTNIDLISSRIFISTRNFDKANVLLERILAKEDSSAARYMLAVIRYEANKLEAALAHLRRITHDDEEFENSITLQTKILTELQRTPEAIALVKKLIDNPNRRQPLFYSLLASLHSNQERLAAGHEVLIKGIELYPDNVQLFFEYGLLLEKEGKQNEAIATMEKVLELQPDHVEALNYLGYTWAENNVHLEKALEYIKKAIALKPDNGFILDSLGWVYFRMGELEKARTALERAIVLEPEDPYIHEHMGDIYQKIGQKDKARDVWYKARGLFKDQEMKKKIQKKIDALK